MQNRVKQSHSFDESYGVHFADVPILEIVGDIVFPDCLTVNFGLTCVRYNKADKMIIKHRDVLSQFV